MNQLIDTHSMYETLKRADFSEKHITALLDVIIKTRQVALDNLATKQELFATKQELKEDIAEVRGEIAEVRGEIAEVRLEIADVRQDLLTTKQELKDEIAAVRVELKGEISEVRVEMAKQKTTLIYWMLGTVVGTGLAGFISLGFFVRYLLAGA